MNYNSLAEIKFRKANGNMGWLSMRSPYSFNGWSNVYEAWYKIVYDIPISEYSRGYYKTKDSTYTDNQKYKILKELLSKKLETHQILKQYLLETEDRPIIYNVSKFSSHDQKWLGQCDDGYGENKLGQAWVELRSEINKYEY